MERPCLGRTFSTCFSWLLSTLPAPTFCEPVLHRKPSSNTKCCRRQWSKVWIQRYEFQPGGKHEQAWKSLLHPRLVRRPYRTQTAQLDRHPAGAERFPRGTETRPRRAGDRSGEQERLDRGCCYLQWRAQRDE